MFDDDRAGRKSDFRWVAGPYRSSTSSCELEYVRRLLGDQEFEANILNSRVGRGRWLNG